MSETNQLMQIVEAALFAAEKPLSLSNLQALFAEEECPEKKDLKEAIDKLIEVYQDRGIELKELASGFQFQIKADYSQWIQRLQEERPPRYSRALLETLALIAYRQPITRGEIEEVRGVAVSSNIVKTLMERDWVREVGHKDLPGKPALLATTKEFLDYFGLKQLSELPPLAEIQDLDKVGKKLAEQLNLEESDETEMSDEDSSEHDDIDDAAETDADQDASDENEANEQDIVTEESIEQDDFDSATESEFESVELTEVDTESDASDEDAVNEEEIIEAEQSEQDDASSIEEFESLDATEVDDEQTVEETIVEEIATSDIEIETENENENREITESTR